MKLVRLMLVFLVPMLFVSAGVATADQTCFKCHKQADFKKKVVHGPVKKGQCYDCHNPHVARYEKLLQRELSQLCYSCHEEMKGDEGSLLTHKPVRQGKCLACHDPHVSEVKGLLRESKPGESCFGCHEERNKTYKFSHRPFANGQCASCHKSHRSENPQLLKDKPDQLCRSCHKTGVQASHKGFPAKVRNCLSCHNPHGSSRAFLVRDVLHPPFEDGCGKCHGDGPVTTSKCLECHEEVSEDMAKTHSHLAGKAVNTCTKCHSPHAADTKSLLRNRQTQVCRECHQDTFAAYIDKAHSHPDTGSCGDCHAVHGSNYLAMLKNDGNKVCEACHASQGQFTHPVGEGVYDPRNSQEVTCVSCHYPHGTNFQFNLKEDGAKDLCIQCHRGY